MLILKPIRITNIELSVGLWRKKTTRRSTPLHTQVVACSKPKIGMCLLNSNACTIFGHCPLSTICTYESLRAMRGIADFIVLISPNNLVYKTSVCLESPCTNSQAEFKPLQLWFTKFCRHGCEGHCC
jgi:hypothetical protein